MTGMILGALLAVQAGGLLGDFGWGGAAAGPVTTQPLAAAEVLLETSATAVEAAPADRATFTVSVTGSGRTREAAEAERDRISRAVAALARASGARDADIESSRSSGNSTRILVPPPMVRTPDLGSDDSPSEDEDEGSVASGTVKVTIRGADNIRRFRAGLAGTGAEVSGNPRLDVADDSMLRRAARAKALASTRADAEAYAASLNMRVARVVRISERTGGDLGTLLFGMLGGGNRSQLERAFRGGEESDEVPVIVFLAVDFALAPR